MRTWLAKFCILPGLLLAGCVGTIVGNPQEEDGASAPDTSPQEAQVVFDFVDYGGGGGTPDTQPGNTAEPPTDPPVERQGQVELLEAWMVFDQIRILEAGRCAPELGVALSQRVVVELIEGRELPTRPGFNHALASVCDVSFRISHLSAGELPAGAPAELAERSLLIKGLRGDGTPFSIQAQLDEELRFDSSALPFDLGSGTQRFVVGFPLEAIVSTVSLDTIPAGAEEIQINETSHRNVFDRVLAQLLSQPILTRDLNEDGAVDPDELDAVLATAGP